MAAYSTKQYSFIVEQLAEGATSPVIVTEFVRRWKDTPCTLDDVAACDRSRLNADWQGYFDSHRAAFETSAPAASSEFRIALLDKWARQDAAEGFTQIAAKHLEQIAKEQAGFYAPKGTAAKLTVDGKEEVTTFTFGLDRAEQD